MSVVEINRALLSVSDKTGIVELARRLVDLGAEIVSSGGTARALHEAGVEVTTVEDVTGAPEMLGGRVKTLHPQIHGGLLADPEDPTHREDLRRFGIRPFQLVVCNLYPFSDTPDVEQDRYWRSGACPRRRQEPCPPGSGYLPLSVFGGDRGNGVGEGGWGSPSAAGCRSLCAHRRL